MMRRYRSDDLKLTIEVQLEVEILSYPTYSQDLTLCGFALLSPFKREL